MPRFIPSGFVGFPRCLVPTPGLTSEYPMYTACACVRIHTHTLHVFPPSTKFREDIENTSMSLSVEKGQGPLSKQQVPLINHLTPYILLVF